MMIGISLWFWNLFQGDVTSREDRNEVIQNMELRRVQEEWRGNHPWKLAFSAI
jgi:hypothetical protein